MQLGLTNKIDVRSHINCVIPWLGDQSQVFQTGSRDMRWSTYTVPTVTLPELAPNGCSIVEMFPSISQELAPEDWNEELKENTATQAVEMLAAIMRLTLQCTVC